ncbi:MAG: class A beta-lactamase-related serine hydrolase [Gemmatimonadetes bacterium]|nr:class A beta-lactamase-related serine hydrolase [Gemmatimonadota bacterium]
MRSFLLAAVVSFGLTTTVGAQALTPGQIMRIDSVFAQFDGTNRPGCAVGVGQGGVPLYSRGYGMSDLQQGTPITPRSIFHVASVSKQFAAFAIGLLAEDRAISLDDPVRKYIPELPEYQKPITIRHLIYHTSGIRDHWELLGMAGWRYPDDLFTQEDVLDIVIRQKALNFSPGDEYVYSNSGYSLLAMIVQRVSGKSLREFSELRIFQPLGMTSTHVHDDHSMIVPGRTSAFVMGPSGWKLSVPNFDTHGATSLFTTVGDLLKWQHNFESKVVGSPGLIKDALTSAILTNGKPANYGFGISIEKYRGAEGFGHGGADAGYRADVIQFPAHHLEIAVACNFGEATPNTYSRAVADIVLEGKLEPRPAPTKRATVAVPAARLEQLAGVYKAAASDQVFVLSVKDGKLVLDNYGLALEPVDPSHFTVFGTPVEFVGPTGAVPLAIKIAAAGDSMVRVPAVRPAAAQLAQFAGSYWSDELRVSYRVELKDSVLVLHPFKHPAQPLRPAFADAFVGGEAGTVRFVRTKGVVSGFRLTGGRVRSVAFVKGR